MTSLPAPPATRPAGGARQVFLQDTAAARCLEAACEFHARSTPGRTASAAAEHADETGHVLEVVRTHVTEVRPRRAI